MKCCSPDVVTHVLSFKLITTGLPRITEALANAPVVLRIIPVTTVTTAISLLMMFPVALCETVGSMQKFLCCGKSGCTHGKNTR
jgi:hypothetical protein